VEQVITRMLAALSMAAASSAAYAGWNQPSGGPPDAMPAPNAANPSIASVGALPYAAQMESSGRNDQILVRHYRSPSKADTRAPQPL
jgi:hypothetical protein